MDDFDYEYCDDEVVVEDDDEDDVHEDVENDVVALYSNRMTLMFVDRQLNLDDELMSKDLHHPQDHLFQHLIEEMFPYRYAVNVKDVFDVDDVDDDDDDYKVSMFRSMSDEDNYRMKLMKMMTMAYGSNRMKMKL